MTNLNMKSFTRLFLAILFISFASCKKDSAVPTQVESHGSLQNPFNISVIGDTLPKLTLNQIEKLGLLPKHTTKSGDKTLSSDDYKLKVTRDGDLHKLSGTFLPTVNLVYSEWYLIKDDSRVAYIGATDNTSISFSMYNPEGGEYTVECVQTIYDYPLNRYVTLPPAKMNKWSLPYPPYNKTGELLVGAEWVHGQTLINTSNTPILTAGPISSSSTIYSKNNKFRLTLQSDGNLVLYEITSNGDISRWNSSTQWQSNKPKYLNFQPFDGNLVLYASPNSNSPWGSQVYSYTNAFDSNRGIYALQNDGNFVMYYPTKPGYYYAVASTGTQNGLSYRNTKIEPDK